MNLKYCTRGFNLFSAWDILIALNTSDADPKTQVLPLSSGIITEVRVKFPAGCHGLVKVRLFHGEFQLLPLSHAEFITGDDEAVRMSTYYELNPGVSKLKFRGSSPGTGFNHTVTVRVTVLPKIVASMVPLIELLSKLFKRMRLIS